MQFTLWLIQLSIQIKWVEEDLFLITLSQGKGDGGGGGGGGGGEEDLYNLQFPHLHIIIDL